MCKKENFYTYLCSILLIMYEYLHNYELPQIQHNLCKIFTHFFYSALSVAWINNSSLVDILFRVHIIQVELFFEKTQFIIYLKGGLNYSSLEQYANLLIGLIVLISETLSEKLR